MPARLRCASLAAMDRTRPQATPAQDREPTLAELLARCDLARLHPDRLRRNVERWKLAPTARPEEAA